MGDEQRPRGLAATVIFLDENHCGNPHIINAVEDYGLRCEKHLNHFPRGTEDTVWLPVVGERGWVLVTTDARIRSNSLEREAVRINSVRMFYFSRNDLAGREIGMALRAALPAMERIIARQLPPFTASINKRGEVTLRDTFLPVVNR